jgi:MFS family permease
MPMIQPWPSRTRAVTTIALLMAALFMSTIDRSILALLTDPIKRSLHLTDTQIGLLQGVAFGIFFMLMTFPAGWLADKHNRMRLVACGIALWSVMTALCGLCAGFAQLFLARMGVAIGEATLQPVAPSIIADHFPPERRTLPMSLYLMGAGMGAGVTLITGGFVAHLIRNVDSVSVPSLGTFQPWQIIFFVVGLPGLIVSVLFLFGREAPRRERHHSHGSFSELMEAMRSRRSIVLPQFAGVGLYQIYAYGYSAWMPAYFGRAHGWTIVDIGLKYGFIQMTFPMAGAWIGGSLAERLSRRGYANFNLLAAAICVGFMSVFGILATLTRSALASALLLGCTMAFTQAPGGPNASAIQEIFPNQLRARVTALYYAVVALVGMTSGPVIVGLMNDHLFTDRAGVGKSLSLTALLTLPAGAILVFVAARRRLQFHWTT